MRQHRHAPAAVLHAQVEAALVPFCAAAAETARRAPPRGAAAIPAGLAWAPGWRRALSVARAAAGAGLLRLLPARGALLRRPAVGSAMLRAACTVLATARRVVVRVRRRLECRAPDSRALQDSATGGPAAGEAKRGYEDAARGWVVVSGGGVRRAGGADERSVPGRW